MVLSLSPVDWAAEWLRPISPSYKYVGPVLAEPGKVLPAHLEVCPFRMHAAVICIGKSMVCTEGLVSRNQTLSAGKFLSAEGKQRCRCTD